MPRFTLDKLEHPIVQAPMAGGPSTPRLAAAVSDAGGLGFLAAGYKAAEAVGADIEQLRQSSSRPFGVNLFVPSPPAGQIRGLESYARSLDGEVERYGTALGEPRRDDDDWPRKLELVRDGQVPVVSFTFGCPEPDVIEALRGAGCSVWVTVTTGPEAEQARAAGADALVVQGVEAGGHRGSFDDEAPGDLGLLALLQLVGAGVDTPLVATGGIVNGGAVAAVLAAGAAAAQLGTAFMLTPEAATSAAHRRALRSQASTSLTRAFTGRSARGVVNRFMREHSQGAPSAYPEVNHITAPLRAAAREREDPDGLNLWAGQAYPLAGDLPAGELVRRLAADASEALGDAAARLRPATR